MDHDISFILITEIATKDKTGQPVIKPSETACIGYQRSVYQNEFFNADQAGIRAQGVVVMSRADYGGQRLLSIDGQEFSIYRVFERDADWIELYYGERVGNGQSSS